MNIWTFLIAALCFGAVGAVIMQWLIREWDERQWRKRMQEILNEYDWENIDVISMSEVLDNYKMRGRDSE